MSRSRTLIAINSIDTGSSQRTNARGTLDLAVEIRRGGRRRWPAWRRGASPRAPPWPSGASSAGAWVGGDWAQRLVRWI
uniref:Uncharacterized protein n=1 Tax=Setaria italica TaxID=4555 RepID=K3Z1K9_SETIT